MHVSLMTSLIATMLPIPSIATTSTIVPTVVSMLEEMPTMMTTSFIQKQIDGYMVSCINYMDS